MDDGAKDTVREVALSFGLNYIVCRDRPRFKKARNRELI